MVKNGCRRKCLGKSLQRCSVKKFSYKFCKSHRRTPVPESLILQNSSGGYIWEFLKREIRKFTIHYTKGLAKKRQQKKQKKTNLENQLKKGVRTIAPLIIAPPDSCLLDDCPRKIVPRIITPPLPQQLSSRKIVPQMFNLGLLLPYNYPNDNCALTISPLEIVPEETCLWMIWR